MGRLIIIMAFLAALLVSESAESRCDFEAVFGSTLKSEAEEAEFIALYDVVAFEESQSDAMRDLVSARLELVSTIKGRAPRDYRLEALQASSIVPQSHLSAFERHQALVESQSLEHGSVALIEDGDACIGVPTLVFRYRYIVFGRKPTPVMVEPINSDLDPLLGYLRQQLAD